MSVTITAGAQTVTAEASTIRTRLSRPSRNIVHPVLGREDPDVTLRPAGVRAGVLELRVATLADVVALVDVHALSVPLHVTDDVSGLDMDYVLEEDGDVTYEHDGARFVVTVRGVQEVVL